MRVKIVINEPTWLRDWKRHRTRFHGPPASRSPLAERDPIARIFDTVIAAGKLLLRLACSLRGHDYVMKIQPRHLALHCPFCGHTTKGWRLDDATPDTSTQSTPHYLELVKRRS